MLLLKDPISKQKISVSWENYLNSGASHIQDSYWSIDGAYNPSGDSIFNEIFSGSLSATQSGIDLIALVDFDPTKKIEAVITGFSFTGEGIPSGWQEPLKVYSGSFSGNNTYAWIRDGQIGAGYLLKNKIFVDDGSVHEKAYYVKIHQIYT